MDTVSPSYIAGFFDGEGYVLLRERRHRHYQPYLDAEVVFTNMNQEVLQRIQACFGGSLKQYPNGKNPIWKLRYYRRPEIERLLAAIYPHLIVKKERVGLVLQFLQSRKPGAIHYTDTEHMLVRQFVALGSCRTSLPSQEQHHAE